MLLFTTPWNSLNLSRLFHCSVIKVLCFVVVLDDSLFIVSYQVCFVKNFFYFLKVFLSIGFVRSVISNATTLISYHVLFCLSITFFIFQKINNQVSFSRPSKSACLSQWTFILPSLSGYVNTFFVYKKFIMSVRITLFSYRYFNNLLWYMQATRALPISLVLVTAIM